MAQERQLKDRIAGDRLLERLGIDPNKWTLGDRRLALLGVGIGLTMVIITVCGYVFGWEWTGFAKRTFWDWLGLLIVPVVLGLGAYLFTRSENRRMQEQADHRREEDVLQAYLDQMWRLLLDKDLRSTSKANSNSEGLTAARVSTLTTLERIHHSDKKRLIVTFFLWMSQCSLLKRQDTVVILEGANLAKADLHEVDLGGANLSGANLTSADLSDANFIRANLSGAYKVTDEKTKQPITNEELVQQTKFLEGATMPNGQKYEAWIKDKEGRGEAGENSGRS